MSEERVSATTTAGRFYRGQPILGKEEKLGSLIYKYNKKDKADMYLRTTIAIADFVGTDTTLGTDMKLLVKCFSNIYNLPN